MRDGDDPQRSQSDRIECLLRRYLYTARVPAPSRFLPVIATYFRSVD